MLGPDLLSVAPVGITILMLQLQERVIRDTAKRLAAGRDAADAATLLLVEQAMVDIGVRREAERILNLTEKEIRSVLMRAAETNYSYDRRDFVQHGMPFVPFEENYLTQQIVKSLIGETRWAAGNITRSLGFAVKTPQGTVFKPVARFYQEELDKAVLAAASGAKTFDQSVKDAVRKMADSGLRTVDYATGHTDRIDVAARRAVLGAMGELTNRQSEHNARAMGVTTYEISWHSGHRPSHGWGGRRFDTTGKLYPTLEEVYARHGGGRLEDFNCYHEKYAVFPDTKPMYTDAQLDALAAGELREIAYEGKNYNRYEARQQQRFLERSMRRQRSLIAGYGGGGLLDDLTAAKARFRQLQRQYHMFSAAMDLPLEYERVYTGLVAG